MTTSYTNLIDCQSEQQRIRALLEACEAERDALALQNLRLREAIRNALDECVDLISTDEERRLEAAVSLLLPDAAREVEAMREKAGLLDEWATTWFAYLDCSASYEEEKRHDIAHENAKAKIRSYYSAALRAAKGEGR